MKFFLAKGKNLFWHFINLEKVYVRVDGGHTVADVAIVRSRR